MQGREIYSKIMGAINYSDYCVALSSKTDIYCGKKRIVITKSIADLSIRFAKEFNLNEGLIEAIAYARDLSFTPYGKIGQMFLKEKYPEFSEALCSVEILKMIIEEENKRYKCNLEIPEELKKGILSSFNQGKDSKEGYLIWMIQGAYELGQLSAHNGEFNILKLKEKYTQYLKLLWDENMKGIKVSNKSISKNILKYEEYNV